MLQKKHYHSQYRRERIRNPAEFRKGSFRTKKVGTRGSKIIVGKLKRGKKMVLQAILHKKRKEKKKK